MIDESLLTLLYGYTELGQSEDDIVVEEKNLYLSAQEII